MCVAPTDSFLDSCVLLVMMWLSRLLLCEPTSCVFLLLQELIKDQHLPALTAVQELQLQELKRAHEQQAMAQMQQEQQQQQAALALAQQRQAAEQLQALQQQRALLGGHGAAGLGAFGIM